MARRTASPARTLTIFFLAIVMLYGLVALAGSWKPALGLDLEGGTRIRLAATGDDVTAESLHEAADIIDNRVNGSGVSEAEVTTEGNQYIVVEIPGASRRDLVDTVKRQAQLRFRVVAQSGLGTAAPTAAPSESGSGEPSPSTSPGGGVLLPSDTATPTPSATAKPTKKATGKNRPPFLLARRLHERRPERHGVPDRHRQPHRRRNRRCDRVPDGDSHRRRDRRRGRRHRRHRRPADVDGRPGREVRGRLQLLRLRGQHPVRRTSNPKNGKLVTGDNPDWPMVTCDDQGIKYLLSTAMVEGTDLDDASAGIPQNDVNWVVSLDFNGHGSDIFAEISRALYGTQKQFAIVLDGAVISAPTMEGIITNGQAQISGSFNQASAESLATSLRYGSLPIAFEKNPTVETIGPSLAGNQLLGRHHRGPARPDRRDDLLPAATTAASGSSYSRR